MIERGQSLLTVEIRGLEVSDYKQVHKALLRRTSSSPAVYATALFLFFFFLYWAYNRDRMAAGIFLLMVCVGGGYFRWLAHREWKEACRRANQQLPARLTLTENGIFGESLAAEGFRTWAGYAGYAETPAMFALAPSQLSYSVIPKSALSATELAMLQSLLQSKLTML